jgi:hypothetical protein
MSGSRGRQPEMRLRRPGLHAGWRGAPRRPMFHGLIATSAVARTVKVDNGIIFYSHAQGSQAYANPDRTYGTGNEPPAQ